MKKYILILSLVFGITSVFADGFNTGTNVSTYNGSAIAFALDDGVQLESIAMQDQNISLATGFESTSAYINVPVPAPGSTSSVDGKTVFVHSPFTTIQKWGNGTWVNGYQFIIFIGIKVDTDTGIQWLQCNDPAAPATAAPWPAFVPAANMEQDVFITKDKMGYKCSITTVND